MANIKLVDNYWETSGIYDKVEGKTQREVNSDLKNTLNLDVAGYIPLMPFKNGVMISNGEEIAATGMSATGYISFNPNLKNLIITASPQTYNGVGAFYNSSKVKVGDVFGVSDGVRTVPIPENAVYFRLSYFTQYIQNITVQGSDFDLYDKLATETKERKYLGSQFSDIIKPKLNLIDKNDPDILQNYYLSTSGSPVYAANSYTSGFVPVKAGKRYTSSFTGYTVVWYDGNKDYLGYTGSGDFNTNKYAIAPENAKFARFGVNSVANYNVWLVQEGGNAASYQDYKLIVDQSGADELLKVADTVNVFGKSKNLLNMNDPDLITGGYYGTNGITFNSNASYYQSGYIPVTAGTKYTSNYTGAFVLWYNSDFEFIGYTSDSSFNTNKYVEAIENASYGRFICTNTYVSVWQVVEGTTLPPYEKYGYVLKSDNPFYGLDGVAFGTSLTYRASYTYGYLSFLEGYSGMNFDNQGIGSATILYNATVGHDKDILAAIKAYPDADYLLKDICIIEGFANDWGLQGDLLGTYTDETETTVCGCLRSAINYIFSKNPNISVFLILDHYGKTEYFASNVVRHGITQYAFYEECAKVAESMGVPVIKEYATSEICERTPQYLVDEIHLTQLGAEQSGKTIWNALKQFHPNVI